MKSRPQISKLLVVDRANPNSQLNLNDIEVTPWQIQT